MSSALTRTIRLGESMGRKMKMGNSSSPSRSKMKMIWGMMTSKKRRRMMMRIRK